VCPILVAIPNAEISPTNVLENPSPVGTTVQYTCLDGFFSEATTLESECVRTLIGPRWTLGNGPSCSQGRVYDRLSCYTCSWNSRNMTNLGTL